MIDEFWQAPQIRSLYRLQNGVGRIVMLWNGTDRVSDRCSFQRKPLVRTSEWWTAKIMGRPFPF